MPPNRQFSGHVRQLVDSLPYKEEVRGSSPFVPTSSTVESLELTVENKCSVLDLEFPLSIIHFSLNCGVVVQLVRTPACHVGGRGFEPRRPRHLNRKSRSRSLRLFRVYVDQFSSDTAADSITASVIGRPRTTATFFLSRENLTSINSSGSVEYRSFG